MQKHTKFVDDEALDPLTEKALEWLVFLHSGEETDQNWQQYESWKMMSKAQMLASQSAESLWASIGPAVKRPKIKKLKDSLELKGTKG